ncbi:hypothetical protein DFR28_104135 [Arenicella xantha]|uniref:Uncharacterized protein n=2 Tax=Arenicella xantha TaxID=644221 RepID=A0A395JGW8_9GAMM|nr:hypothetical protein DFR28_104135 [Arenicella xantha]
MMLRFSLLLLLIMPSTLLAAEDTLPQPVNAQVVWVEPSPGHYQIMVSNLVGDEWADPISVYQNKNPLAGAVLISNFDGDSLLVWSEQSKTELKLLASLKPVGAKYWQSPQVLSDLGKENTGATAVVDLTGKFWVFWASNVSGMDDIYLAEIDSAGASSAPRRVHTENEVPDYYPSAELNQDGDIELTWKTFNLDIGDYVVAKSVFELDSSSKSSYKLPLSKDAEVNVSELPVANFLPVNASSMLHIPRNRLVQVVRLGMTN